MKQEEYDAVIDDLKLVNRLRSTYGYNRILNHVGFILSELGIWKAHSLSFGNYPRSLVSDKFTEMVHESSYNPDVRNRETKSLGFSEYPLLQDIESLIRSREYWYDIFAYLLFCNKYGYPSKTKNKKYQIKTVQTKHSNASRKDIRIAWKILEQHGLIAESPSNNGKDDST